MNRCWVIFVSTSLVAFTIFVITWQCRHYTEGENEISSIARCYVLGKQLAKISNIEDRSRVACAAAGSSEHLDLILPENARVFMLDMTGTTNYGKIGFYYFVTYYLFPREIGVSLDQPARQTKDGFLGTAAMSDGEIITNGFNVKLDAISDGSKFIAKAVGGLPIREPVTPDWFSSTSDTVIAGLLPLLTALAGMWLFRLLFPTLSGRMPLPEQLAGSLGLGMMAIAALTLGIKLCGFHGYRLMFLATATGAGAELWCQRKAYWAGISDGCRKLVHNPVALVLLTAATLIFLILFRLAGLQGLMEFDAVMAWSLKAKILHLYTGSEIVQWFSNPRLAHAHLDYPTLVPSLHAATYDSLGHVDEFVTKFWPVWMLLFLLAALASLNGGGKSRRLVLSFALLGLLLLPAVQKYAQFEGGTLPMVFFTVLGFVQCALWLMDKDPARLGLGLTLLFGAAMAKFEGFIFLALVAGWMLLLPSARPAWKSSPGFWRVLTFCFLTALPFLCLRVQIPSLHYESGWAGYALHNPGSTLAHWPAIFLIVLARMFLGSGFASWSGEGGPLHWVGQWEGLSSLSNQSTLGLAWLCLFLTIAFWFALPARRPVIVWILAMLVGALAAFSGVFASFVNVTSPGQVLGYTADDIAGRYLLPVLLAWFATMMTVFLGDQPGTARAAAASLPIKRRPQNRLSGRHSNRLVPPANQALAMASHALPHRQSALTEMKRCLQHLRLRRSPVIGRIL